MTYHTDLQTEEWRNRRLAILKAYGWRCALCGAGGRLEVHHRAYVPGRRAWQYPDSELVALCSSCHEWHHRRPDRGQRRLKL